MLPSSEVPYEHERNIKRKPVNPDAYIDPYQATITYIAGNRGSGKSSLDEYISEKHYLFGHTVVDLHSVGYESLYWVINHNCRGYFDHKRIELQKTC